MPNVFGYIIMFCIVYDIVKPMCACVRKTIQSDTSEHLYAQHMSLSSAEVKVGTEHTLSGSCHLTFDFVIGVIMS